MPGYAIGRERDETPPRTRRAAAGSRRARAEGTASDGSGGPGTRVRNATLVLAIAALVLSLAAGALALTRSAAADPASCRATAWDAIPAIDQLPSGWSLNGTSLDADGYSTALVGPTASNASSPPDSIFLKVTCFGPDAHQAFARSQTVTRSGGATEVSFPAMGDESFEARNGDGSAIVFVRRGGLIANLGASSGVDPAVLEKAARALDSAMASAEGLTPAASTGAAVPTETAAASSSIAASVLPSAAASPSGTPQHAAPDLEALLPHTVNGTALETQSTDGATGLGTDASSKSLLASLQALGKKASDLQIAAAYDPLGSLDLNLIAFRAAGVTGSALKQEVLKSWLAGAGSGIHTSNVTVGGKQVVKVDYGDGGTVDYLYAHDAVVIDVASSDANLAGQVLASLP